MIRLKYQIKEQMAEKAPIKVAITGAVGQIGGYLTHMIAQGNMFGPDQPVTLALIELPVAEQALQGNIMELRDCAYPLVAGLEPCLATEEGIAQAFTNA